MKIGDAQKFQNCIMAVDNQQGIIISQTRMQINKHLILLTVANQNEFRQYFLFYLM